MLQNRYGDREFPIRDRWRSARLYRDLARRRDPSRAALRGLIWIVPAVVVLLVLGADLYPWGGGVMTREEDVRFLVALGLFVLMSILGLVVGTLVDRTIPRRELQRYRRLTGAADVTARQQQLLSLDAQSDFAIGGWNSSLDYAPAWSMLPAEVRRQHEHGAKRSFFVTMPLFEVRAMRAKLDADEQIASSGDVELWVADALRDSSLSARFHRVLQGQDGERMLARVASLTGTSQWDVRALDEPSAGRPARLLWGADTQRVVAVVRMAYLAEHVDAETAWRLIDRGAQPAAGLFGGWEEYWANVRVGAAFSSDRLEVVQQFDESLTGLRASSWPAATAGFPAGPVPSWLPVFSRGDERARGDQG